MARTQKNYRAAKVCALSNSQFRSCCLTVSSYLKEQLPTVGIETANESQTAISIKLLTHVQDQDYVFGDYLLSYHKDSSTIDVCLRIGNKEVGALVNAIADLIEINCKSTDTLRIACSEQGIALPECNNDANESEKKPKCVSPKKETTAKSVKPENSMKEMPLSTRVHQSETTENNNTRLDKIIFTGLTTGIVTAIFAALIGANIEIFIVVFCFASIIGGWIGAKV